LQITNNVNTAVAGDYTVEYVSTDSKGLTVTVSRTVTVAGNKKPSISNAGSKTIGQYYNFNPLTGVVGKDAEDGDITNLIKYTGSVDSSVPGTYTLRYTLRDSDNGFTVATRTITVVPNTKPILNVGNHSVKKGSVYTPASYAAAYDAEQGKITSQIVSTTTVNTAVKGKYTTTYSITDNKAVTNTKTVTVTVY
jgi:hypothetical protein